MSYHHHNHLAPPPTHYPYHHQSCCSCQPYSACNSCTTTCCCSPHPPPPNLPHQHPILPPNPNSDQLLQALTTHLLIQSQPQPQPPKSHQIFLKRSPAHPHQKPHSEEDDHHLLQSLIQRVSALESSLSATRKEPPSFPQPQSLKHLAAVTIQRHFGRFLARRSRTLRDLKELASIKSHAAALRSSLDDKTLPKKDALVLSQRAMDLLFHLDSIRSSEPMIREGKRSISRELVRVSEFVEKILLRENDEKGFSERDRHSMRGRRVSFAESRNEDQLFDDLHKRVFEEEGRRRR